MRTEEFYAFMKKRESLRLRKEAGDPWPWSDDEILNTYKFTNVKRSHDRTTKWFWDALDNNKDAPLHVILFNCALFRYFGTIEFYESIGWQPTWNQEIALAVKARAQIRLDNKQRVFTGAYVITNQGISAPKQEVVVDHFLWPLWHWCSYLVDVARRTKSWETVATEMMKLKGFGGTGFMTKEVLQDAMHTEVLADCTDRNTWCPVGPGAHRGINRLMERDVKARLKTQEGLDIMRRLFNAQDEYWPDYGPGELELHDIQFQLCEFDKHERVKLGQGRPRSKYKRR